MAGPNTMAGLNTLRILLTYLLYPIPYLHLPLLRIVFVFGLYLDFIFTSLHFDMNTY